MKYINRSVKKYLNDLAKKIPAPGGGSAAALSSATAVSLILMSCGYTLGKKEYNKQEKTIKVVYLRAKKISRRLMDLVDEDIIAYKKRDMHKSIAIPMEVCFLSFEAMQQAYVLIEKGNKFLKSDVVLAALLCDGAINASLEYVCVNCETLGREKRKKYDKLIAQLKKIVQRSRALRKKMEANIG